MGKIKRVFKGKKKGSSILMVLMVATVLIMLSAVVSSALVFTTKGNEIEKVRADYLYAAEGGIEYGVEEFTKAGPFTGTMVGSIDTGIRVDFLSNTSVTNDKDIFEVRVVCKDNGDGYDLISTVYNRNKDVLAKVTVPIKGKIGMSKILEYSVASASRVDVISESAIDFGTGKGAYNSNATAPDNVWNQPGVNPSVQPAVQDVKMLEPKFRTSVVTKRASTYEVNDFTTLLDKVKADGGKEINPNGAAVKLDNGLGYYTQLKDDENGVAGIYTVIFISAPKVIIKECGVMNNTIIVCDGEIEIQGAAGGAFSRSTIYAPKFIINTGGSIALSNAPLYNGLPSIPDEDKVKPIDEYFTAANVSIKMIKDVDDLLIKYMTSFGASSEISGRPVINYEDAIYEY